MTIDRASDLNQSTIPRKRTDSGQITNVQPPFAGLFCNLALNDLFSTFYSPPVYSSFAVIVIFAFSTFDTGQPFSAASAYF